VARGRIRELFLGPFAEVVRRLIDQASREGCSPAALASHIAEANHTRIISRDGRAIARFGRAAGIAGLRVLDGPLVPGRLRDRILFGWAERDLRRRVGRGGSASPSQGAD
jgi:hypothetical protein